MPTQRDFEPQGDSLFNMPFSPPTGAASVYSGIIEKFAAGRKIDILEIGVFMGRLLKGASKECPDSIKSWTGVDPYIGDDSDPYFKAYWGSDGSNADKQYQATKALFDELGGNLQRMTSDNFFAENKEAFDFILVDGDHRVGPALRDLHNSLKALRPGGLLVCDDYGNSDTPEVTRAVVRFVEEAGDFHDASGFHPIWFQNARKPFPIKLSAVYWRKKGESA